MKDNNDIQKDSTVEMPLLKSDLMKKLYNNENSTEDNIEKLDIVSEPNTNTSNKSDDLLLTTSINIEKIEENKNTNDIKETNLKEETSHNELHDRKNDKELNDTQDKSIDIEKTKIRMTVADKVFYQNPHLSLLKSIPFVGLKDKNGSPIHFGDILKDEFDNLLTPVC